MKHIKAHLSLVAVVVATAAGLLAGGGAFAAASPSRHLAKHHGFSLKLRYIQGSGTTVPANSSGSAAAQCPSGMYPIGGGPSSSNNFDLNWSDADRSSPSATYPDEWTVGITNPNGFSIPLKAYVVCANASKVSSTY